MFHDGNCWKLKKTIIDKNFIIMINTAKGDSLKIKIKCTKTILTDEIVVNVIAFYCENDQEGFVFCHDLKIVFSFLTFP